MSETAEQLFNAIRQALEIYDPPRVKRVRVTGLGTPGWVHEVPMHPDHADLYLTPAQRADLTAVFMDSGWPREIIMHPDDWAKLLSLRPKRMIPEREPAQQSIMGIPVWVDAA